MLVTWEDFIAFTYCESLKYYMFDPDMLLTFKLESFTRWAIFNPWFLFNDVCQKKWDIMVNKHM